MADMTKVVTCVILTSLLVTFILSAPTYAHVGIPMVKRHASPIRRHPHAVRHGCGWGHGCEGRFFCGMVGAGYYKHADCIDLMFVCDGTCNCWNGIDELYCGPDGPDALNCNTDEKKCNDENGEEICAPNCDQNAQCADSSDESFATCGEYVGCLGDSSDRILADEFITSNDMTRESCHDYCSGLGYLYAGVQYASQCFCGNTLKRVDVRDDSECNAKCTGSDDRCGGTWRMNVFRTDGSPETAQSQMRRNIDDSVGDRRLNISANKDCSFPDTADFCLDPSEPVGEMIGYLSGANLGLCGLVCLELPTCKSMLIQPSNITSKSMCMLLDRANQAEFEADRYTIDADCADNRRQIFLCQ